MTLHAFGDSVTYGDSASNLRGWPVLVSEVLGEPLTNHAVRGHQVPDTAPLAYGVQVQPHDTTIWMPGFNDMRWWGLDPLGLDTYTGAVRALMAWLAIPEKKKTRAVNAGSSGGWTVTSVYGQLGQYSAQKGAAIVFSVRGDTVYLGGIALQSGTGLVGLQIDGLPMGVWRCGGVAPFNSALGYAPFLIRVPGLDDRLHSVTASVVSTSGTVYVDWCASNHWATSGPRPAVYVSSCLRLQDYSSSQQPEWGHGSEDAARLYSAATYQAVEDLASDGLDVTYVDTLPFYDLAHGDNVPPDVHPNDQGHQHLADAYLAAMG